MDLRRPTGGFRDRIVREAAFTSIELLVVIGFVGIVAAMLLLARAPGTKPRRVACAGIGGGPGSTGLGFFAA